MKLNRYGSKQLIYDDTLNETSSKKFEFLRQLTKNSLDRMLMQSDVRDIYHGIKSIRFHPMRKTMSTSDTLNGTGTFENMEIYENGLVSEFNLQLSENTESDRLSEILVKQLRKNHYKIGNTDLTTFPVAASRPSPLVNVTDFDECESEHDNDCSHNAQCYNLKGTYTCACRENYADASEVGSIYPGRKCTNDQIGCERCHFNGKCPTERGCECYRWYFGPACQFNLKIILYATCLLFVLLLIFLFVLFFCILMRRNRNDPRHKYQQHLIQGILAKPAASGSASEFQRSRSAHDNDADEVSSNTTISTTASQQQLRTRSGPKGQRGQQQQQQGQYEKRRNPVFYYQQKSGTNKSTKSTKSEKSVGKAGNNPNDSMTVMIPRAKFHSQSDLRKEVMVQQQMAKESKKRLVADRQSVTTSCYSSQIEAKLLSYLDHSGAPPERKKSDQRKVRSWNTVKFLLLTDLLVSRFRVRCIISRPGHWYRRDSRCRQRWESQLHRC